MLNGRVRLRDESRPAAAPADRARSGYSLVSLALRVLASLAIVFLAGAAQAQRPTVATHIVRPGETLGLIAQHYGVDIFALASANGIRDAHRIYSWQQLTIPAGSSNADPAIVAQGRHIVRPGESLDSIASHYGINLSELIALNNIFGWIYPGDELALPVPGEAPAPVQTDPPVEASGITHKVQFGESLAKIAAAYGVSLYDLQTLNNIWTSILYVGQEVEIPAGGLPSQERDLPPEPEPEPAPTVDSFAPPAQPKTHTVQRGETLFSIAKQYGILLEALIRANGIEDAARIHAGNKLRVSRLDEFAAPTTLNDAISPTREPATPLAAPAGRPVPVVTTSPAPGVYPASDIGRYTVRRGEYLTDLGVRFNMEWRVLAKINGISPPNYTLHHQQTLRIPSFAEYLSYLPDNSIYKLFYTTHHHPGPRVGVGREIVIELGRQSIYAYENGVLKKRALMSSGKMVTPTVLGDYEIYRKYRSQTMSGPGYSLDNVEWPMYFYAGYAIHGTWWHTMFGTPMSHGCVNLTNADAKWFWEFAPLGTPVHVRY